MTHRHLVEMGYCNRGARLFCRLNGIDWADFVANGIPAARLLELDDTQAAALAQRAIEESDVE